MTFFPQIDQYFPLSDIFLDNLGCLFLAPVPASANPHALHVLAFVVSRFSAGNYLDNTELNSDNIQEINKFCSAKAHQLQYWFCWVSLFQSVVLVARNTNSRLNHHDILPAAKRYSRVSWHFKFVLASCIDLINTARSFTQPSGLPVSTYLPLSPEFAWGEFGVLAWLPKRPLFFAGIQIAN